MNGETQQPIVNSLGVWKVDDDDLIVANSEKDARSVYREYHCESTRGHKFEKLDNSGTIELTDHAGEDRWTVRVRDFAIHRGYTKGYR